MGSSTAPPDARDAYIYGAGGHARVVADVLQSIGFRVVAQFNDSRQGQHPATVNPREGLRIIGIDAFPRLDAEIIIAVGNNLARSELDTLLATKLPSYITAVHPSAVVASTSTVGEGSVILHRAVVQPNTVIGRHVLVNTAASVDHDNLIEDFAHICPGATLCGHVTVKQGSHIGAGATVIQSKTVGKWSVVAAGAVVISDVPDYSIAIGVPARIKPIDDFHLARAHFG